MSETEYLEAFDCWCGAKNITVDYSELESGCGGSGTLHCFCGGGLAFLDALDARAREVSGE